MSELLALGETEKLEALRGLSADKVLDSFETVRLFNDRFALHAALASLEVCAPSGCVATPCSREWRRDDNDEDKNEKKTLRLEEEMPLPWMCKPRTADGSAASHQLFLVYEAALLAQALRGGESEWQIQPFLPHGGVLIKVYVLGDLVSQQCRPSLPDALARGEGVLPLARQHNHRKICETPVAMDSELLDQLVAEVRRRLGGATLFGMDVLRGENGQYSLVDVNYFPGFYGVSDVFARVTGLVLDRLQRRGVSPSCSPPGQQMALRQLLLQQQQQQQHGDDDEEENVCGLFAVARISDLFGYLLGFVCLSDYGALARSCRTLQVACGSRAAWQSVLRRYGARADRLPGFSRHPRRTVLESVLPPVWQDGGGSRTAALRGGHVVAARAIGAHEPSACLAVRVSECGGAFVGVGLSCGGDVARNLWLAPNGMPCLVLGSGLWQRGSRLAAPSAFAVPEPPRAGAAPLVLALRLAGGRAHFFVARRYLASLALPAAASASWRLAAGGASGLVTVLLDEPVPPVPEHQRLLL